MPRKPKFCHECPKRTLYRISLSALAFFVATITIPFAAIAWPFVAAIGMWWESEDIEEGNA